MRSKQPVGSRKPYRKPSLKLYGDIKALTSTVDNTATMDGGSGTKNRTH